MNTKKWMGLLGTGCKVSVAMGVLALAGCAQNYVQAPPTQYERGVLLQRVDAVVNAASANGSVRLSTTPDPVVTGQAVEATVTTVNPGYLYLYQVATDGRTLSLVFPNAIDAANYIPTGQSKLPREGWRLKASGPAGTGYLLAVMTTQPLNALAMQSDAAAGNINLPMPYAAALATLREVAP